MHFSWKTCAHLDRYAHRWTDTVTAWMLRAAASMLKAAAWMLRAAAWMLKAAASGVGAALRVGGVRTATR